MPARHKRERAPGGTARSVVPAPAEDGPVYPQVEMSYWLPVKPRKERQSEAQLTTSAWHVPTTLEKCEH